MSDPRERWLTAAQAAAQVGVKLGTIRVWVHRGYLTPVPVPGRVHYYRELDVLLAEQATRRRGAHRKVSK